jgi:hypothetical protein
MLQDEAAQTQSASGLPMFGEHFPPDQRSE